MINRLVILFIVFCYLVNYKLLMAVYPRAEKDWNEFLEFYNTRNIIYEWMWFLFFCIIFNVGDRVLRTVSVFGLVVVSGSLIDKALFKISHYIPTDLLLVLIGIFVAHKVYKYGK